jgi:DNA helicase-2/ATP-dependent DNA helicase PcrA
MPELTLCEQRKALLATSGHMLVLGGPGSGKTTIALAKAATDIGRDCLLAAQKTLFLSFARATVTRIVQQAEVHIGRDARTRVEVNTYHGFAWDLIRSHGHLLTGQRFLRLLPPPEAASRLAGIGRADRSAELQRLLKEEGLLGFDLFATLTAELLESSSRLCRLIADCYPFIILDEFQDTNLEEWRMISALGKHSTLIALADAEQRIYEFRGADPERIGLFITEFIPTIFDFGKENNRSNGTDICDYGNDVLSGQNVGKLYQHVTVTKYRFYKGEELLPVKAALLAARARVAIRNSEWSLAVLVKSRDMMLRVSTYLGTSSKLPAIQHDVLLDPEGPALAAVLIGGLLEGAASADVLKDRLLSDVISHIRGRKGGDINQVDLKLTDALTAFRSGSKLWGSSRTSLVADVAAIAEGRIALELTGDPERDWLTIRDLVAVSAHDKLLAVVSDARFVRLLNRGTQLRDSLSARWRSDGCYATARQIVADALLQEHFSASTRAWTGVNVMTIHKAKGKEFDEVILFEGGRTGRFLRDNATEKDVEQARLALRVGVTRARQRTTLLTPSWASSTLL